MASTNQLKIISYNSTGFNDDKLKYLNDQSLECDIILVQEHWLLSNNLKRIINGVVNFTGIANSGMDEIQCILPGRPYGGCAILWNKEISQNKVQVKSLSKRVCCIMLTLHNNYKLLIICAYFPNDPGTVRYC